MNEKEAVKYLIKKGKISPRKSMTKEAQNLVDEVVRKGKIYGDPIAMCQ